MLADGEVKVVVTETGLAEGLAGMAGVRGICLDGVEIERESGEGFESGADGDSGVCDLHQRLHRRAERGVCRSGR
jgi:hypothetical protein